MADNTKIEWTEATWNPITGCSVHSAGCTNCYAMKLAGTRLQHHPSRAGLTKPSKAGPVWTGEVRFNEEWLTQPLQWKRPRMIFVCAHADLFHENVPDEWIDRIFAVMALCPQHTFQVLTKRSDRMREYLNANRWQQILDWQYEFQASGLSTEQPVGEDWPLPNVWLGVSVENQAAADERIPYLLATPAAVRWISAEPLLGPVDLTYLDLSIVEAREKEQSGLKGVDALTGIHWDDENGDIPGVWADPDHKLDWVVAGGESGSGARPMHPDWARSLRHQCAAAGTPFFFKQWGSWAELEGSARAIEASHNTAWPDGTVGGGCSDKNGGLGTSLYLTTKKAAGRLLDGVEHNGMPAAK